MAQFVHQRYGLGLARSRPAVESVAAEESRLSLHLTDVQAVQQRLTRCRGPVEGNDRVQAALHPLRVARVWRGSRQRGQQRGCWAGLSRNHRGQWSRGFNLPIFLRGCYFGNPGGSRGAPGLRRRGPDAYGSRRVAGRRWRRGFSITGRGRERRNCEDCDQQPPGERPD